MIIHSDCIQAMSKMEPSSIDAIITDPPYGLEFMGKEWDKFDGGQQGRWEGRKQTGERCDRSELGGKTITDRLAARPNFGKDTRGIKCLKCGHYKFSGTPCKCDEPEWEIRTGTPPNMAAYYNWTTQWASEALRVLKPGGSLLSFGGTRTFHRLTCGLEDSGFIIKDCLMWLYGQGFPKAQDLGKMIDKRLGAEREVVGDYQYANRKPADFGGGDGGDNCYGTYSEMKDAKETAPATPLARHWDGYKIGGIKPAWEPIIWAVKPPEGAWIDNVLRYGTGAVNVDECRVEYQGDEPTQEEWNSKGASQTGKHYGQLGEKMASAYKDGAVPVPKGRFPANLLLSHADGCREVGTKRVISTSGSAKGYPSGPGGVSHTLDYSKSGHSGDFRETPREGYADPDGYETVSAWECVEDCPVRLLDEQSGVRPSAWGKPTRQNPAKGFLAGNQEDGESYGDTGGASRFFYTSKATDRQDYNDHPTLKPTDLIEWLIRLVTRPGQLVLDPFAGSGTTGVAAIQSGREFVLIEQDLHYISICERRTTDGAQQGMF